MRVPVTLPPGWKAELQPNIEIDCTFGYYRAVYSQQGRLLRIAREMARRRDAEPPDSIGVLIEWIRAVSADRAQYLLIENMAGEETADSLEAVSTVALEFGWPVGMSAQVTARRSQIRSDGFATPDSVLTESSYRMLVEDHDQGLLVGFSDFQLNYESGAVPRDPGAFAAVGGMVVPGCVISPRGDLPGFENFDGFIETFRSIMQPILDTARRISPNAEEWLQRMMTEQYFYSTALEKWGPLVSFWAGAELEVGVTYDMESDEPSRILPGRTHRHRVVPV